MIVNRVSANLNYTGLKSVVKSSVPNGSTAGKKEQLKKMVSPKNVYKKLCSVLKKNWEFFKHEIFIA